MKRWPLVKLMLVLGLGWWGGVALVGCASVDPAAETRVSSSDQELRNTVMGRLGQEMLLNRASISVSSDAGVVTLRGVISSEAQRMRALAITRATPGVLGVIDHLRTF